MAGEKTRIGIIGCGNIFPAYVRGCRYFDILEIAACADIDADRARQAADAHGIPRVLSVDALLADPDIEVVVNLTIPSAHADVSLAILRAGKHLYSEKPLAVTLEDGAAILQAAEQAGVRVGCAPDTFLGGGQQTCRKLIDDGWIGQPVAASAFFMGHGPEGWHPNPDFFYQTGGGPVLDLGPYYLTALVNLLGPVRRLGATTRISFPERVITNREKRYGERIPVEVSTHATGVLDFHSGLVGTMILSFDVWSSTVPRIEVYGSEGTLVVPDPNHFGGAVQVRRAGDTAWHDVPLSHDAEVGRGIGVADMAYAIRSGRPHRASGALAYHVLELMHAFDRSSQTGAHVALTSPVERPAALPLGLLPGTLDC